MGHMVPRFDIDVNSTSPLHCRYFENSGNPRNLYSLKPIFNIPIQMALLIFKTFKLYPEIHVKYTKMTENSHFQEFTLPKYPPFQVLSVLTKTAISGAFSPPNSTHRNSLPNFLLIVYRDVRYLYNISKI